MLWYLQLRVSLQYMDSYLTVAEQSVARMVSKIGLYGDLIYVNISCLELVS